MQTEIEMKSEIETIRKNWSTVKETIRREYGLTGVSYKTWLEPLEFYTIINNEVNIIIPSDKSHALNYISSKYTDFFQVIITEMFNHEYEVKFILEKDAMEQELIKDKTSDGTSANNVNYENANLNPKYKFDTFVVGSSNKFAHAAALAVAQNPAASYNPLFIYGPSGLGKTHLLYAIAGYIARTRPPYRIVYVKGDDFTNELISAIQRSNVEGFREKYRMADLLLVDDIQFIAGKESTQEEFFHTFNNIYEAGHQIVITSDRPPVEMTTLDDRLRTRFEGGLIADVQSPDLETRIAITRNKAALLGMILPDDIVNYIAENLTSNIRQIEGVVKRLTAYSNVMHDEITIEHVKRAIKDVVRVGVYIPTPEVIIENTARYFNLTPDDLRGQRRSKNTALARQVSMYLMRQLTNMSFKDIGAEYENRNHATVMASVNKIQALIETDKAIAGMIRDITSNINSNINS